MGRVSFEIPECYGVHFVMIYGWICKELTELLGDERNVGPSSREV